MSTGIIVKVKEDSGNLYELIDGDEKFVQMKCVWFSEKEDLGDQIFCTYEGQEIWVASYHAMHYENVNE